MAGREGGTPDPRRGPAAVRGHGLASADGDGGPPLRLFVALPVAERAAAALSARLAPTRTPAGPRRERDVGTDGDATGGAGRVRWVLPGSLHLTLRFLGATDPARLADARSAIRRAVAGVAPFTIELGRFAILGGSRSSTLVCEVSAGRTNVEEIEQGLSAALEDLGWPPERRGFRPHVTVARTAGRGAAAKQLLSDVAAGTTGIGIGWRVERIVLFESHLGSGPPRYEERAVADVGPRSALGTPTSEP